MTQGFVVENKLFRLGLKCIKFWQSSAVLRTCP